MLEQRPFYNEKIVRYETQTIYLGPFTLRYQCPREPDSEGTTYCSEISLVNKYGINTTIVYFPIPFLEEINGYNDRVVPLPFFQRESPLQQDEKFGYIPQEESDIVGYATEDEINDFMQELHLLLTSTDHELVEQIGPYKDVLNAVVGQVAEYRTLSPSSNGHI